MYKAVRKESARTCVQPYTALALVRVPRARECFEIRLALQIQWARVQRDGLLEHRPGRFPVSGARRRAYFLLVIEEKGKTVWASLCHPLSARGEVRCVASSSA